MEITSGMNQTELKTAKNQPNPLLNKSSLTNLTALAITFAGYVSPVGQEILKSTGMYALSGAFTNWLAIYMLFEKIPGLYGSGVIPARFGEFKEGIRHLIMSQFFTEQNLDRFFAEETGNSRFDLKPMLEAIDYEELFSKLLSAIQSSPLGAMLAMVGGEAALEPVREPFTDKMKEALSELSQSDDIQKAIRKTIRKNLDSRALIEKVEEVVNRRLEELTPRMVKEIIQEMIRKHLGWLVVWGGIFGGLIGMIASFL